MTNEEYEKYSKIVYKIAHRFRNNGFVSFDDLVSIGNLALVEAYNDHDPEKGMKLSTWIFQNVLWSIKREIKQYYDTDIFVMSLYTPIDEEEGTTLEDLLKDMSCNVEQIVLDKLTILNYRREIEKVLDGDLREIVLLKVFEGKSHNEIAAILDLEPASISRKFKAARMKLVQRSNLFRNKYIEIHNLEGDDLYKNRVENIAINRAMNGGDIYE